MKFVPSNPFQHGNKLSKGRPRTSAPLAKIRHQVQKVWDKVNGPKILAQVAKDDPKWFLAQVFSLLPKTREIDLTLTSTPEIRGLVRESMQQTTKYIREMRASGEMQGFSPFVEEATRPVDSLPAPCETVEAPQHLDDNDEIPQHVAASIQGAAQAIADAILEDEDDGDAEE